MSLFVQDVFTEARTRGLTDGFVGTYADLKLALEEDVSEEFTFEAAAAAEAETERLLEDFGWADKFWEEDARLTGALAPWEGSFA